MKYLLIFISLIVMGMPMAAYSEDMKVKEKTIASWPHPPQIVDSLDELKDVVEILYKDANWCISRFYELMTGVGYGYIIIYEKKDNKWRVLKSSEKLLLPKIEVTDNKIVVMQHNSLNNATYSEVYSAIMYDDTIEFIVPSTTEITE